MLNDFGMVNLYINIKHNMIQEGKWVISYVYW